MSSKFDILEFPHFSDERGTLTPFEFGDLPFVPKRAYLVTAAEGAVRGGHAHLIEEEIFIAAKGSVTLLVNDGSGDRRIFLDSSKKGALVCTGCWHELLDFSPDAVVLALSSTEYLPGEGNYQTDKEEFLEKG